MNKSDITKKISVFYEKMFNDAGFADRVRSNPKLALAECGIDMNNHNVSIELKIDDEVVHHFVIPSSSDGETLSDEEMQNFNAAKTKVSQHGSLGTVLGTASSADVANVTGENRRA